MRPRWPPFRPAPAAGTCTHRNADPRGGIGASDLNDKPLCGSRCSTCFAPARSFPLHAMANAQQPSHAHYNSTCAVRYPASPLSAHTLAPGAGPSRPVVHVRARPNARLTAGPRLRLASRVPQPKPKPKPTRLPPAALTASLLRPAPSTSPPASLPCSSAPPRRQTPRHRHCRRAASPGSQRPLQLGLHRPRALSTLSAPGSCSCSGPCPDCCCGAARASQGQGRYGQGHGSREGHECEGKGDRVGYRCHGHLPAGEWR